MPSEQAENEPGSLRLVHAGGGYDQTLAIATHFVPNGDQVDLLFKNVPKTSHYSLNYIDSSGKSWSIFQDVPYTSLNDYSPPDQYKQAPT
jgi:hypothetical protein